MGVCVGLIVHVVGVCREPPESEESAKKTQSKDKKDERRKHVEAGGEGHSEAIEMMLK